MNKNKAIDKCQNKDGDFDSDTDSECETAFNSPQIHVACAVQQSNKHRAADIFSTQRN